MQNLALFLCCKSKMILTFFYLATPKFKHKLNNYYFMKNHTFYNIYSFHFSVFLVFLVTFSSEIFAQKNTKNNKIINKKQVFEEADAELYVQNFKEAIKLFDKYIKADTTNEDAYFKRGNAHFNLNNLEKADTDFSKTLRMDTANFEAYLYKGVIRFRAEKYDSANFYFEKSLKFNFNQPVLFNYLAESHHLLGNLDVAIKYYDDIIVRFPAEMALYLGRANCYFDKADYRNAITDFDKVLSTTPRNLEVLRKRAQTKFLLSDFQGVINDLEEIESKVLAENFTESKNEKIISMEVLAEEYSLKAFCQNELKQPQNAILSISKAIELDNIESKFVEERLNYFLISKKYPDALKDINKIIDLDKENTPNNDLNAQNEVLLTKKADILVLMKNYKVAEDIYANLINISPKNANYHYQRGLMRFYLKKKKKEIKTDIQNAKKLGFDKAKMHPKLVDV